MLLSLPNKKGISIWKKKDIYNLIVINKNLLLSKNKKINKKIKQILVAS